MDSHCYLIKLHVTSKYPTQSVLRPNITKEMNSHPAQWKHPSLITCPSHHLLRILDMDMLMMSWLNLTDEKLSVAPTPLHQWSMRRKFLSLWK